MIKTGKLFKRLSIVGIMCMMGAGFTSCREDVKDIFKGEEEETEEAPNDFDFSTWQNVDINVAYDIPSGYRIPFFMYSANPLSIDEAGSYILDTSLLPFWEGYTDKQGKISIKAPLAAYVNDIYIYSPGLNVPVLLHASISNGVVGTFEKVEVSVAKSSRTINLPEKNIPGATAVKDTYKDWPKYAFNCITNATAQTVEKISLAAADLQMIEKTLPATAGEVDKIGAYYIPKITLKEKAHVYIYVVGHNSTRTNALTYFTYKNDMDFIGTYEQNAKAIKLTKQPRMAIPNLVGGITQGTGVMLLPEDGVDDSFDAGTIFSFGLLVDAYEKGELRTQANIAFSTYGDENGSFNDYSIVNRDGSTFNSGNVTNSKNNPHMMAFRLGENKICIAFEDQPWHAGRRNSYWGDFRDDVFILEVDPESAIPDNIKPGDVDDNSYVATSTKCGILAFEDSWPEAGDYDMNDVVLSYIRKLRLDQAGWVTSIDDEFVYLNNGATYKNAFGYELGGITNKGSIKKWEVISTYSYDGQGLDKDLEKPTVMLFDKAVDKGTSFKVHIDLNTSVPFSDFSDSKNKWNPFIVVNENLVENRTEVHLPMHAPTTKANMLLFGTGDDKSNIGNKRYYVRSENNKYPFAIELSGVQGYESSENPEWKTDYQLPKFKIPEERVAIETSYPYFVNWYESDGAEYKNWYTENPTK